MSAKTGMGAGGLSLRDYPDRESYLFAKYAGDLLSGAENARLYGMCAPCWESPDDALKENRRQRPKEAAWLSVDTATLLHAARECLHAGDLTDEGLDALRAAVSYLDKHHKMKFRRLREQYVKKVYLESGGDRRKFESILQRERALIRGVVATLWLLTAISFLPALNQPLIVKLLLCATAFSISTVLKTGVGVVADHRARALEELSKIKWRVSDPSSRQNRAGRRKAAKEGAAMQGKDVSLHIKGLDGFTEVHGVRVPQKALRKPLKTTQTKRRPNDKK